MRLELWVILEFSIYSISSRSFWTMIYFPLRIFTSMWEMNALILFFSFFIFAGYFPLESVHCLVWMCLDVLFCTASIMHLCTISIDRYLSLRYPMRFGRNKTRKRVTVKIIFVWILSIAMSLPLSLMYSKVSWCHLCINRREKSDSIPFELDVFPFPIIRIMRLY